MKTENGFPEDPGEPGIPAPDGRPEVRFEGGVGILMRRRAAPEGSCSSTRFSLSRTEPFIA